MESLDAPDVESSEEEIDIRLLGARHFREPVGRAKTNGGQHFRDGSHFRTTGAPPQRARATNAAQERPSARLIPSAPLRSGLPAKPLVSKPAAKAPAPPDARPRSVAKPAVKASVSSRTQPKPKPKVSRSTVANGRMIMRLHNKAHKPTSVWPQQLKKCEEKRCVWPADLHSNSAHEIHEALNALLFHETIRTYEAVCHSKSVQSFETLPFYTSRWDACRQIDLRSALKTAAKPVPVGVAAGVAAVLTLSPVISQGNSANAAKVASATQDAEVANARVALLEGPSVATPVLLPAPTTTLPPTTTTTAPPPTTAAPKPAAKKPASVPADTSGCSKSKAAAHECWDGLLAKYSWNTTQAFNIMWCESKGNPNAKNPRSTARGLFQILGGPLDPEANVKLAFEMYSKRGWQPWVCRP